MRVEYRSSYAGDREERIKIAVPKMVHMDILNGSQRLGNSVSKTTSATLIICPNCGTKATYATVQNGIHLCRDCDAYFGDDLPTKEIEVKTLICERCSEETHKIPENRNETGSFDWYFCSNTECSRILEVESGPGTFVPVKNILSRSYTQSNIDTSTSKTIQVSDVDGAEEESVVELLNTEARAEDSSFRLYDPDNSKALLAYRDDSIVGYLLWGTEKPEDVETLPVIRQVFTLSPHRQEGVATNMIQHFICNIVPAYTDGLYAVEGANTSTLRVLESMGEVSFTVDTEAEHITDVDRGNVVFYKTNPFRRLATEMAQR